MPLTEPVPPGHGEHRQGNTVEQFCWCGRPLTEERTMVGANRDVVRRRIVCPAHGYAKYVVQLVQLDGVPQTVFRSTDLSWACTRRDELRRQYRDPSRAFVGVYDEDDPERGWIDID